VNSQVPFRTVDLQTPVGKEGVNSPVGKEGANSLVGEDGMNSAVGASNETSMLKILHQGEESMFRGEELGAFEGRTLGRASGIRAGAAMCGKAVGERRQAKAEGHLTGQPGVRDADPALVALHPPRGLDCVMAP
jgi:hypothetical protein